MSTRPLTSDDAQTVAELARVVRERPNDRVDPYPPAHEFEVLADAGARGRGPERHPVVAVQESEDDELVVGYGAVDAVKHMQRAQLVGPVVHPAYRRQGHGARLLDALLDQARVLRQKTAYATVAVDNGAAEALLKLRGFKKQDTHTCLRLSRTDRLAQLDMDNVRVRRVDYDDWETVYEFTSKLVPRTEKQARSLLKSEEYAVVLAYRRAKVVGFAELDMRYGDVATVEQVDGVPSLLNKGLGNVLLAHLIPEAFRAGRKHVELVVAAAGTENLQSHLDAGFEVRCELGAWKKKL